MENYKTLKAFAKSFNITKCYDKRFLKRKGGYVFECVINNSLVDVIITPLDKDNQPVVFCGSLTHKTIQGLQKQVRTEYKIDKKTLAVSK